MVESGISRGKGRAKKSNKKQLYGTAEWYGHLYKDMTPQMRASFAGRAVGSMPCPFLTQAQELAPKKNPTKCNKIGGVCSLRNFEDPNSEANDKFGPISATCPNRFLEDKEIVSYIAKYVLNINNGEPGSKRHRTKVKFAKEIPFLIRPTSWTGREVEDAALPGGEEPYIDEGIGKETAAAIVGREDVGRIDLAFADPKNEANWCAVEMQAVYFSGARMSKDHTNINKGLKIYISEIVDAAFQMVYKNDDRAASEPKVDYVDAIFNKILSANQKPNSDLAAIVSQIFMEEPGILKTRADLQRGDGKKSNYRNLVARAISKVDKSGVAVPKPNGARHPDFRSSGPKRLMPQLMIKVPTLRRWGKKMVVVIDEPFLESMPRLGERKQDDLSNADIVWVVVKFDDSGGKRAKITVDPTKAIWTTLEDAVVALTSGDPTKLSTFQGRLSNKFSDLTLMV